jgi:heat-inducible transcriptional repressor
MLSFRARRILFALVSEYLSTAEPVASAVLAKAVDLSSATVRAVLAELEGQGYLHKPHTSAGRLPTERALRVFVDALVASVDLEDGLRETIEKRFASLEPGPDAALRATGKLLAEVSGAVSVVVVAPQQDKLLRELRFIALRPTELLAVVVTEDGAVQNRILKSEIPLSAADLERSNNIVASFAVGKTLADARAALANELENDRLSVSAWQRLALALGEKALATSDSDIAVIVEGQAQLIHRPEFADIDRARQTLRMVEDKALLLKLLDQTLVAPGIQVTIGTENELTGASELSVVATEFEGGTIGVIGSTRIDYSSVVPAVRFTAGILARTLSRADDDPKKQA